MTVVSSSDENTIKHARGADGQGRTLCGMAIEGECADGGEPPPVFAKENRFVSCAACTRIIYHCQLNFTPHAKVRFDRG